jgi:hypothetical protein
MQYATYLPVVYDVLDIRVYKKQTYDVTLAHVGTLDEDFRKKVDDRIQKTLYRAGVEVNFEKTVSYVVPDIFENEAYRERDLNKNYLYVVVDTNKNGSDCYVGVRDDLYWLKSKIESDIGYGQITRRAAVILNLPTVKFWTIDNNYIPCTKNLEDKPGADSPNGYIVGILNNEKYEECKRIYPSSGEVYYSYDHFDEKMHLLDKFLLNIKFLLEM